ncbi:hypothetical protein BGZ76_005244 [Entomortierella beljakovae]|nr:hypothetical protein BGZ76_005244 [Entomortierella beljakovae]
MTSPFRSQFDTSNYVIDSSTPLHKLSVNLYNRKSPSPDAVASGSTPSLIFAHANGFCKETWEPLISRMNPRWTSGDLYAFDCRNQGDSAVINKDVLEKTFDWYSYANDILKVIDTFGIKNPIAVGHSILAETIRPGTFSAIVAIESTMFPKFIFTSSPLAENHFGQKSLRRRDTWKHKTEAKQSLLESSFFKTWHPEALDHYVEYGMIDIENEDGSTSTTLKCPKYQEAITFAHEGTGLNDAYEQMSEVDAPIYHLTGSKSDINMQELAKMKADRCKNGALDIVEGGHCVNFEKPQECADLVSAFLDRVFVVGQKTESNQIMAKL